MALGVNCNVLSAGDLSWMKLQEGKGYTLKRLKNSLYLILLTVSGVVYLSFVDNWQIYATPLAEAKARYQRTAQGEPVFSDSVVVQDQNNKDDTSVVADPTAGEDPAVGADSSAGEDGSLIEGEKGSASGEEAGQPDVGSGEGEMPAEGGDTTGEGGGFSDGSGPVYMSVEDDYFADAVFIGDSRTVGLYEYGGLEEITTFYASKGLTVYKLFSSEVVEIPGEKKKKKTIEEGLKENQFKKIYLMVGINEMGTGTVDTFAQAYGEVVEHLLELQPDAVLYIQGILKVTTERSGQGDYINNEGIVARNEAIAKLADNERIFYLDVNPLLCDDTGGMEPSYTFDGVHLKAQYIDIWKNYLKEHAVDPSTYT